MSLVKLGFRRKAFDKMVNAEDKGVLLASPEARAKRKQYDTLSVGLAGAASTLVPGVPFQAATAKALAPKEKSTRAAVDATTGSFLGTATGGTYLVSAAAKDKGGVKPLAKSVSKVLKKKSNPNKAKKINLLGKRVGKLLPKTTVSGKKLETKTKIPVEKIQRFFKGVSRNKSKLKGAGILAALGSGVGSAIGYERALNRNQEKEDV